MAQRPVFVVTEGSEDHVKTVLIDFTWYPGFSIDQKRKSIESLHEAFHKMGDTGSVLEISSASPNTLGQKLSAFSLSVDGISSVESIFQGSKVFRNGGPYIDLYKKTPREAKKDERIRNSGDLTYFNYKGERWPLTPQTFFYDWLYLHSLQREKELTKDLVRHDAFTDIEFNPKKSINCQAFSAALYVSLYRKGVLEDCLKSPEKLKKVYNQ